MDGIRKQINNQRRLIAAAITLAALLLILSGCGAGVVAALKIVGVSALLPDKWTSHGDWVKIIADIVSGNSLLEVVAHVTDSDDKIINVVMTRNAEGQYEGSFEVPAQEAQPETYTAVVTATDDTGNQATSETVTVEVPPATDVAGPE